MFGDVNHFFEVQVVEKIFGDELVVRIVYDISHNIGKVERHEIDGAEEILIVLSKWAIHFFCYIIRFFRNGTKRLVKGVELRAKLKSSDIIIRCKSDRGLAEEAPTAYKDVDNVVSAVI